MYKISIPVMNNNLKQYGREATLAEIKKFGAERIFLALNCYELDEKAFKENMSSLKENCKFFKEKGYEVGAWTWTFMFNGKHPFTAMRDLSGNDVPAYACPTDEKFLEFSANYLKEIAKTGVDLIMFDDDFRFCFLGCEPACLCDNHIANICDLAGEDACEEHIRHHILNGKKNKWRDAYINANGNALKHFAKKMREAVDSVDPNIRLGACTCLSSWDIDGVSAKETAYNLAGSTKPFLRLIGAPYWANLKVWGNNLQDVIELERMESSWTCDGNIEIMAEGDAFPRPRINCPASFLEGFDTAIRASGCTDGILKYGIDYVSSPSYETGYARFHQKNSELYKRIDKAFSDKASVGVRVYECPSKVSSAELGGEKIENMFFSLSARMLACNSIPTVYEGDGITGIVFGENARHMPLSALKNGLILDTRAAKLLSERGIDVGMESFGKEIIADKPEHFIYNDNEIAANNIPIYNIKVKANAEILSYTEAQNGRIPISFCYENALGNRFLVLNAKPDIENNSILRHYERGKQVYTNTEWLSGKRLPAYSYGNPSLYIQCKEDDTSLSVGVWNFFADIAFDPVIKLADGYSSIEFINGFGKLEGNKVFLEGIPAFGFTGFVLKK